MTMRRRMRRRHKQFVGDRMASMPIVRYILHTSRPQLGPTSRQRHKAELRMTGELPSAQCVSRFVF